MPSTPISRNLAIIAAVLLVVIGSATLMRGTQTPQQTTDKPKTTPSVVTLGVITYDTLAYRHFNYVANVTLAGVNAYAESKGYPYRFDCVSRKTTGIQEALEKGVVDLNRSRGAKIFLGFDESEAMCASLSYALSNHILLIGVPLIHHDSSALPDDIMFRIAPNLRQVQMVAVKLVQEMDFEAVEVIQRGDSWADGIKLTLDDTLGEENVDSTRYNKTTTDYTTTLEEASTQLTALLSKHDVARTAVVLISSDETARILEEATKHPSLMSVTWIIIAESPDPYNIEATLPDLSNFDASSVRVVSIEMAPLLTNGIFDELQEGYASTNPASGDVLGLIDASFHDSIWVACLSVLEANTTDVETLKGVIPGVAGGYLGASGGVLLDSNGDRAVDYYVYELLNGGWSKIGVYDAVSDAVSLEN